MYEIVSVDQAIEKGLKIVVVPALLITPVVVIFLVWLGQGTDYVKVYGWFGIALGIAISILYWRCMSARWRLWAFDNVRNVHELERRAKGNFIIGWGSAEKLRYKSTKQIQQWAELQQKFNRPDIFIEDFTVHDETQLHYSKFKAAINFSLGVFFVCCAPYFYFSDEPGVNYKGFAVVSLLLGGFLTYSYSKKYNSTSPPIMLSNRGIENSDGKFYSWDEISNENTQTKYHGETSHRYLVFETPDGLQEISIDDLAIRKEKLEHLLHIYRGRFEHRKQQMRNRL